MPEILVEIFQRKFQEDKRQRSKIQPGNTSELFGAKIPGFFCADFWGIFYKHPGTKSPFCRADFLPPPPV